MADEPSAPEGWPDSAGQFDAHGVSDTDLARWEEEARQEAWRMPLGRFNWPGAMRSLIEEVRRVKRESGNG